MAEHPQVKRGFGTEYTENYCWSEKNSKAYSRNLSASGLFDGKIPRDGATSMMQTPVAGSATFGGGGATSQTLGQTQGGDPTVFQSQQYPSVYREVVIHKDDRGKYIDPFKNLASKPYGRRLQYDPTHPDKMYASQYSSELADHPGPYSFPTTTGLPAEQPWAKDLSWTQDAEQGQWPTEMWKNWTPVAQCPTYNGHSDQPEYSKYKVQVP